MLDVEMATNTGGEPDWKRAEKQEKLADDSHVDVGGAAESISRKPVGRAPRQAAHERADADAACEPSVMSPHSALVFERKSKIRDCKHHSGKKYCDANKSKCGIP